VLNVIESGAQAGDIRESQGNFLIRSARLFIFARFNVAMLDAEPAFPGPAGLNNQRLTQAHADHLGAVIGAVRTQWPGKPVWLVGTSNGTLSTVNAAARLTGSSLPNGIVLTSAITASGTAPEETGTVLAASPGLANISVPTLVAWHAADQCSLSHNSSEDRKASQCRCAAHSGATASTARSSPCATRSRPSSRLTSSVTSTPAYP
jgi:alpha-beta hydrolase superfamily lysophospholipase